MKERFYVPSRNVKMGEICGCEFFIDKDQFEYFKHSHITVDVRRKKCFWKLIFIGNRYRLSIYYKIKNLLQMKSINNF